MDCCLSAGCIKWRYFMQSVHALKGISLNSGASLMGKLCDDLEKVIFECDKGTVDRMLGIPQILLHLALLPSSPPPSSPPPQPPHSSAFDLTADVIDDGFQQTVRRFKELESTM